MEEYENRQTVHVIARKLVQNFFVAQEGKTRG
jgi:hypothetical protein